jgi:hypothetical protein
MNARNTGCSIVVLQLLHLAALKIMTIVLVAVVVNMALSAAARATSICRWVDESGKAQFSDVVPSRYSSIVSCTHTQNSEPSVEQRAANARAKARGDKAAPVAGAAPNSAPAGDKASQPVAKQPSDNVTDSTDCKTWQRLFSESGACFAPFRTALGGIKAEAFAVCNEVPNPEAKCGPKTD